MTEFVSRPAILALAALAAPDDAGTAVAVAAHASAPESADQAALLSHGASQGEPYVWKEYGEVTAEIERLTILRGERHREVMARYGRNDTPEALAILAPIDDLLQEARQREQHLLCRDQPVIPNPQKIFESMGIRMAHRRVDSRWVESYIEAKVADGALAREDAARLRFILSKAGHGVMNPSSRGAGTINQRIAQALSCFGLDGPPRSRMRPPPEPTPEPPKPRAELQYYRTCGDHVCRGYRGPLPGVQPCGGRTAGAPCAVSGERCDLGNSCNMLLECAATDPATRCPR